MIFHSGGNSSKRCFPKHNLELYLSVSHPSFVADARGTVYIQNVESCLARYGSRHNRADEDRWLLERKDCVPPEAGRLHPDGTISRQNFHKYNQGTLDV